MPRASAEIVHARLDWARDAPAATHHVRAFITELNRTVSISAKKENESKNDARRAPSVDRSQGSH